MTLDSIKSDFGVLDDWEDRYRYVIDLGRELPDLPQDLRTEVTKVRGCASQVWLVTDRIPAGGGGRDKLAMRGASDALIVQGLTQHLKTGLLTPWQGIDNLAAPAHPLIVNALVYTTLRRQRGKFTP